MSGVVDAIRRFERTRGPARPVLAAVSGGADSVALLRGLLEAGLSVAVAHFNHRLRGAESDADEAFVRELAGTLGLPVRVGSADVRAAGGNLEATARRLRYDWLARTAGEVGAGWVATGHTADDQAETVLHHVLRGTGVAGLRGIAADRPLSDEPWGLPPRSDSPPQGAPPWGLTPRLVRPILAVTRADVLAYLAALGQPFRHDPSNADPTFTRNRIRHDLMPLLKTFNPEVVSALGRLAEQAGEADRFVTAEAHRWLERWERPRAGGVVVLAVEPAEVPSPFLAREAFRLLWRREGWPTGVMREHHWRRLADIAGGTVPAADFPGGVHVRRAGAVVQLRRRT